MPRTVVMWKSEVEEEDGESSGPVWVDTYGDDPEKPEATEKWEEWVRRSVAERYANEQGFEFVADE